MSSFVSPDRYSLSCQAQALACLLMLERCKAPPALRVFDTTPELLAEFAELAFSGCDTHDLQRLYERYAPLEGKPTYQRAMFDAILAFCRAPENRLEAASGPLGWERLMQDRSSPGRGSRYKQSVLALLLNAAAELAVA